jgi:Protein of unknown function (DUF2783)
MNLIHTPNIADPDGFYEELIASQRDLPDEQVELMNAKLVLLLANHVGDRGVLREALQLARPRAAAAQDAG